MAGKILRAAESALNLEHGRLQKLKQLDEEIQALKSSSNEVCCCLENSCYSNLLFCILISTFMLVFHVMSFSFLVRISRSTRGKFLS